MTASGRPTTRPDCFRCGRRRWASSDHRDLVAKMRSLQREPGVLLALLAVVALVAIFIVYPQVRVVLTPGSAYANFLSGGSWVRPLGNSLQVMALSTTTAVLIGFVFAYAMVYTDMRWKPLFKVIGILPLLSPPFVVAASYLLLFGPRGMITYGVFGQTISIFGLGGIWGVQTIAFFPFAYQLIADVLSRSDARMEQAARNLGARPWSVFRTVTLPLSRPGLGAAILTTAIYVLEDFGNPALVGGPFTLTFPVNTAFTTSHFEYVFSGVNGVALRNTLVYGLTAAAFSSVFALLAAWLVQRGIWSGRRILDFLLIMPAAVPGLFFGIGYATAFNEQWLDWLNRGVLIIISMIFWNIPVGYQAAVAGLRQIDRTMDEAATSLGASSLRGFRDVLVPMLGGSLRVGFVTTFVRAVTTLSVVIFLFTPGTTVATIRIFQLVNDLDWGGATAFTVIDIGLAMVALGAMAVLARGRIALGASRA